MQITTPSKNSSAAAGIPQKSFASQQPLPVYAVAWSQTSHKQNK